MNIMSNILHTIVILNYPRTNKLSGKLESLRKNINFRNSGVEVLIPFKAPDIHITRNKFLNRFKRKGDIINYIENSEHIELVSHATCLLLGIEYKNSPIILYTNGGKKWKVLKADASSIVIIIQRLCKLFETTCNSKKTETFQEEEKLFTLKYDVSILPQNVKPNVIITKISSLLKEEKSDLKHFKFNQVFKNIAIDFNETIYFKAFCLLYGAIEIIIKDKNRRESVLSEALPKMSSSEKCLPAILRDEWCDIEPSTKNYLIACTIINNSMIALMEEHEDYKMHAFPLCVAFEQEINLSIVQLIRQHLGVKMPDYFEKYCPEVKDLKYLPSEKVISNPREIHLNNARNSKWIPPALGETRLIYETIALNSDSFIYNWIDNESNVLFIEILTQIQKIRNKVAHPGQIKKAEFELLQNKLKELHKNNILNRLTKLKVGLRS